VIVAGMTRRQSTGARVGILSHIVPPAPSGQPAILERLLECWSSSEYCFISVNAARNSNRRGVPDRGPGPYVVPRGTRFPVPYALRSRLVVRANAHLQALHRGLATAAVLRQQQCTAVVACTGDLIDLPAAYIASQRSHLPLYLYIFDDYVRQWVDPHLRSVAQGVMPRIVRHAAGVIVTNEFLRDAYADQYGIKPVIVRNPCAWPPRQGVLPWPADPGEVRVVYTGSVYEAQYDAFHNLLTAIERLEDPRVRLHIYTSQPARQLAAHGIAGPVEVHNHVSKAAVAEVQSRADILFLPLAFDSPYPPGLIRTSAPGKMPEYLSSGRPVLVHVPSDSFVAWYVRERNCGVLVDGNDVELLAVGLRQIITNPALRAEVIGNAQRAAAKDFSLEEAQQVFRNLLLPAR
jgi:glycosyltransferase involved in cell wall biosynthesis